MPCHLVHEVPPCQNICNVWRTRSWQCWVFDRCRMFAASLQLLNNGNLDLDRRNLADLTLQIRCLNFEDKRTGIIAKPLHVKVKLLHTGACPEITSFQFAGHLNRRLWWS